MGSAKVFHQSSHIACNRVSARGLLGEEESKRPHWSGDVREREAGRHTGRQTGKQKTRKWSRREEKQESKEKAREGTVPGKHF